MAAMSKGMGVSRSGRPVLGLQTLIDRIQGKKPQRYKLSGVSLEEAELAAQTLQKGQGRVQRFRDAVAVGSAGSPLVRGMGRAMEAGVNAPRGQRLRHAATAFAKTNRGELARHVVEGGLGGAAVNASREGLELGRARRKAMDFLRSDKTAAVVGGAARAIGKQRVLLQAGDVWGHNTIAARHAAQAAGAPQALGAAAVGSAPAVAKPAGRRLLGGHPGRTLAAGTGVAGAGYLVGQNAEAKLAAGIGNIAARIRPVPVSKLRPIVDDEIDFEV